MTKRKEQEGREKKNREREEREQIKKKWPVNTKWTKMADKEKLKRGVKEKKAAKYKNIKVREMRGERQNEEERKQENNKEQRKLERDGKRQTGKGKKI